jgi:hypothetical protein
MCGKTVTWTPITGETTSVKLAKDGHYYLPADVTVNAADNGKDAYLYSSLGGGTACLQILCNRQYIRHRCAAFAYRQTDCEFFAVCTWRKQHQIAEEFILQDIQNGFHPGRTIQHKYGAAGRPQPAFLKECADDFAVVFIPGRAGEQDDGEVSVHRRTSITSLR